MVNDIKKIIIAAEIFPPDIGGPATYGPKIAMELVRAGFAVKLICYGREERKDDYPFEIFRIKRSKFKLHYFSYHRRLKKIAGDCDVIYAQGPVSSGWPASKVAKQLGKKLVVKVVGDYAWEQARNLKLTELEIDKFQEKKFGGKIGWLQKIERQVCQRADKVIVPSQYLKRLVSGWGVEEGKIEVVYNSIDFTAVDLAPKPHEENWAVSVGRLLSWKGFDTLIRITPEIIKQVQNYKLIIIGDGPEKNKLEKLVTELNLQSQVKLLGQKTKKETLSYIQAADLFVLNSSYEGLSHVILEAMSFNTYVLASRAGGNLEIVLPGENGELFEYNNAEEIKGKIVNFFRKGDSSPGRLLKTPERKEFFAKFEFEKMVNDTIKTLSTV